VRFRHVNLPKHIVFAEAEAIAAPAMSDFIEAKVDSVHLIYNEFKSVIAQKLVVEQLLPLEPIKADEAGPDRGTSISRAVGAADLRRAARPPGEVQVMRALLESTAAFYAAQMTAMDAATRNSADIIDDLTLTMNKIRQAAITRRSSRSCRRRRCDSNDG
jgi:F-type H+-transporting ATPase subunit gamma